MTSTRRRSTGEPLILRVADLFAADRDAVDRALPAVLAAGDRSVRGPHGSTIAHVVTTGAGTLVTLERRITVAGALRRRRVVSAMTSTLTLLHARLESLPDHPADRRGSPVDRPPDDTVTAPSREERPC